MFITVILGTNYKKNKESYSQLYKLKDESEIQEKKRKSHAIDTHKM